MAVHYVAGAPGSGKTTLAAKKAVLCNLKYKADKRKRPVYSMTYIQGANRVTADDFDHFDMSGGLILCDEAGITFGNRDWKSTPKNVIHHFKMHRHFRDEKKRSEEVYIFSQVCDDVDKKLVDVCTDMLLVKPLIQIRDTVLVSTIQKIRQTMDVDEIDHQVKMMAYKVRFSTRLMLNFRYWKYFDSWEHETLPMKEWPKW